MAYESPGDSAILQSTDPKLPYMIRIELIIYLIPSPRAITIPIIWCISFLLLLLVLEWRTRCGNRLLAVELRLHTTGTTIQKSIRRRGCIFDALMDYQRLLGTLHIAVFAIRYLFDQFARDELHALLLNDDLFGHIRNSFHNGELQSEADPLKQHENPEFRRGRVAIQCRHCECNQACIRYHSCHREKQEYILPSANVFASFGEGALE
mmetsp:Transcript_3007/g.4664  ORF Transcript_3007/g.4664 Transcript_3007/m.4664 type:complete len:208 (-) Transcript_3007:1790-2413(-)